MVRTRGVARVSRIDVGRLGKAEQTPQGGYRIPAYVTRTGVLEYLREDGTVQREYRPPEEVFAEPSLESLSDAVVTDFHQGMVNPATYREVTVGHVSAMPAPARDGDFVAARLVVLDANEIALIDAGERVENSCGYDCTLDITPGVTPEGLAYDAVQKNIVYNHVALLPRGFGRAGNDVQLRLDAKGDHVLRLDAQGNQVPIAKGRSMAKHMHTKGRRTDADGAEGDTENMDATCPTCGAPVDADGKYAPPTQDAAPDADGDTDNDAPAAQKTDAKSVAVLQAKLDAANDTIAELRKSRLDAAGVQRMARERASLERTALKVGLDESKLDGFDDDALRREVIGRVFPMRKLDGKPAAYIEATYDSAREMLASGEYRPTVSANVETPRADSKTNGLGVIETVKAQLQKDGVL